MPADMYFLALHEQLTDTSCWQNQHSISSNTTDIAYLTATISCHHFLQWYWYQQLGGASVSCTWVTWSCYGCVSQRRTPCRPTSYPSKAAGRLQVWGIQTVLWHHTHHRWVHLLHHTTQLSAYQWCQVEFKNRLGCDSANAGLWCDRFRAGFSSNSQPPT